MARSHFLVLTATAAVTLLFMATTTPTVHGQVTTGCTPSMISSFTPCMNFVTNSSSNGTLSPTSDCCNSLKSLTTGGLGCLCLIVTGNVPIQIPVNRTLAISLPRACNMPGVPVQCKATAAPIPAPGPGALAPIVSPPASSPTTSPKVGSPDYQPDTPALAPKADTTPLLTPPSPTVSSVTPSTTTGSHSSVNPSSSRPTSAFSPTLLLFALASALLKYY